MEGMSMAITDQELEFEFVKCNCCGMTEECSQEYIEKIRERYQGKWVCGLCSEAIDEEIIKKRICIEEAVNRHEDFYKKFSCSSPPTSPNLDLIFAIKQLCRKTLDSPRGLRSTPSSPSRRSNDDIGVGHPLARSESCFSSLGR
ncbi:hypothetical protein C5167_026713 [Papaver somniferum]|uniref:uncharacterized protein LOC113326927 n=1 Tax=Papaver somniferum TaxID=3469 RepID=UPI000E6F7529|nr:uncharacterized protein LOC113326927 [Papaver somniferum]RZC86046.1 hypothetical protein C5167_026713 [Papaver somniferum]